MTIHVPDSYRETLQRIADAAGYKRGVDELVRELYMDPATLIKLAVHTVTHVIDVNLEQVMAVAGVARIETMRHSRDLDEQIFADILGINKEGAK